MSVITQVSLEEMLRAYPGLDRKAIGELKEWNASQVHQPRLYDADLAVFYLNNCYDMEATKKNVDNYFLMRHHMPAFFATRNDLQSDELKEAFDTVFIAELPQRTRDNNKVILACLTDYDPRRYKFTNAVKALNMLLDAIVYEGGPDNKCVFVFDIKGATEEHGASLSSMDLKKYYDYMRRGSPIRWIGAHYFNSNPGKSNGLQEFVKTNIVNASYVDSQVLHFHSDLDTMMDAAGIDRSMLPREMGGNAGYGVKMQKAQMKRLEALYAFHAGLGNKIKLRSTESIPTAVEVFVPDKQF